MTLTQFENLVAQMRQAQITYEQNPTRTNEKGKKQLEKQVDEYLRSKQQVVSQPTLF